MEALRKKLLAAVTAALLFSGLTVPLAAEEETETGDEQPQDTISTSRDFSDTGFWTSLCTGEVALTEAERTDCAAYMNYISSQTGSLKDRINEIESQREVIKGDIAYYGQQVATYDAQAAELNGDISRLSSEISIKEAEIEILQGKIDKNQEQIDAASDKILARMEQAQGTMRLNQWLDILMGATSFEDFIRIANGLSDITNYDEKTMSDLAVMIDQLEDDKKEVEEQKAEVEAKHEEIVEKQNEILVMKYQAQVVEEEMEQQFALLMAEGNQLAADIESIQETMRGITEKLNEVAAAPGWTYPLANGYLNPYAGTWYYEGGGLHLGGDYVGPKGSALLAVGNGVILNSVNGCGDGYIGDGCVGAGGTWGGGNQIDALFKINGGLYAVKYSHMLLNSPIPKGTVVMAGDVIGSIGQSGNASGPHSHIEIYYLGSADLFTEYATNWDGNLSFHCDWYSAALAHICEDGASAPCRIRPESVFGSK